MPKLQPDQTPTLKLDAAGLAIEISLTREQLRGLFDRPGTEVVGIVRLQSKSYTGYDTDEDKDPQVKVRAVGAEMARTDAEAKQLLELQRAMFRKRKMDNTLDEIGPGTRDAETAVASAVAQYPSESEYRHHEREQEAKRRAEFVR